MRLDRLRRYKRPLMAVLLIPLLVSLFPTSLLAITSGPAQEEFANFEAAQTTDMVNLYTGDFTYNIPLMTVPGPNGGYPINLFYNSGVDLDEAGSWVGLGWNLNVGAVNRQLRGLPDDFNGDVVKQEMHLKNNFAIGIDFPASVTERFGFETGGGDRWNGQLYYNNYKGLGYRVGTSFGIKGILNVNVNYDAQNGIGIDPVISLKGQFGAISAGLKLSTSYNSRKGLKKVALKTSLRGTTKNRIVGRSSRTHLRFVGGGTSNLSFGFSGGVPDIQVPTRTSMINFDLRFSGDYTFPTFKPKRWGNWRGYVQWSRLRNDGVDSREAYGYLYNQNADERDYRDFNRTGLSYSKKVPNLSTSAYTYDPLVVTGVGVGGQFRPYRSRVEVLHTPRQSSRTDGHRINLELGTKNTLHLGLGYAYTDGEEYSGPWRGGIPNSLLNPSNSNTSSRLFQDAYYLGYGEQTGYLSGGDNQLEAWLGSEALRPALTKGTNSFSNSGGQFVNEKTGATLDADNYLSQPSLGARTNRTPKPNYLQKLTEYEASQYGFSKDLRFYTKSTNGDIIQSLKFGSTPDEGSGKISEIIVNKDDGYRYVYGLPASNAKQVDAAFNVYPPYVDENGQSISDADANTDRIQASGHTSNKASKQYESKKTLPRYAHSWLLTHIASPDYQDLTGDGMSADDPGSWMQFHYLRTTGNASTFKYQWREPYVGSSFAEGQKSNPADDMASYVYGEKDLFYLRMVETATHLALFETSPRDDATGVAGEANGGIDPTNTNNYNKMYRLDRIKLYVKNVDGSWPNLNTATPIQTAVFSFADPSQPGGMATLCPGIPSSETGAGKLTLEQVYLTSEQSNRGRLSPYRFSYGPNDAQHNPAYERRNRDRWGNYQDNTNLYNSSYPYVDFPYTDQYNPPNADAWQLQEITLPTGGKIKVDYEADDYAYEMDQAAAQMFDIIAFGNAPNPNEAVRNRFNPLFGGEQSLTNSDADGNYRLYIHLSTPIPSTAELQGLGLTADEYFKRYYLADMEQVYYKTFVELTEPGDKTSDYIAGYAKLLKGANQYGVVGGAGSQVAFLTLAKVASQKPFFGQTIHPFQRAALEHLKFNRSELVNGYDPNESDSGNFLDQVGNIVGSIFQFFEEIAIMQMGFNRYGVDQGWGEKAKLNGHSIVRLYNGTGFMYGGGNRVAKLTLSNEWSYGAGADEYGQQYDYRMEENGRTISSGVAITPQGVGGDESALRYPVDYKLSTPLVAPQHLFVEKPMMKGYYPGPGVGYRKVTVKSLTDLLPVDIDESYAPIAVHEFYTHKDFPVRESETDLSSATPIYDWAIFPGFGSKLKKHTARSQGYSIELNNMAGKPKAMTQRTYPTANNPEGTLISRSEYVYQTEAPYSSTAANYLSSTAQILQPDGTLADGVIGQSHDIFHDFHENASSADQYGADFNIDFLLLSSPPPPIPIIVPSIYPEININETSLRTAVTHKVIYKTGLLDRVVVTDGASTITTKNIAYDPVTAQPLLTRTTNEFKDYIYNVSEPAHWKYDDPETGSMAGAYRNLDLKLTQVNMSGAALNFANPLSSHVVGDELWLQYPDGSGAKVYVTSVSALGITVQNEDGSLPNYNGAVTITTIRSGHRNHLTAAAASTSFKGSASPISSDLTNLQAKNDNILNTTASTYRQNWASSYCDEYFVPDPAANPCTVRNELLALLNVLANPNLGSQEPFSNGLTYGQDDLFTLYPQQMTTNIWPNSPATYWPFYTPGLYNPSDPFPPLVSNELHLSFRDCSDCFGSCDLRLLAQNVPVGFDWADITEVTSISGTDPNDLFQFSVVIKDAQGNTYTAVSTLNTCYEICPDGSTATSVCDYVAENCAVAQNANLFVSGNQGNWRMHESYVFKTDREYEAAFNEEPRLREFGAYENFAPFSWDGRADNVANGWVRATEITRYSPHGEATEEKDALDNYAAVQFGYHKQLAVGIGQNMQLREIAVDNFEDYDKDCTDHFRLKGATHLVNVVDEEAHTGRYSLRLAPSAEGPFLVKYLLGDSDPNCQATFRPIPGNRYVVSAWVKETRNGEALPNTTQYSGAGIRIQFCDGAATTLPDIKASGLIIDGWQRIYADFTVPATAEYFELRLINESLGIGNTAYFDDLRIHPFLGNMTAVVYDRETYKVAATLDENNYATFAIRDQAGAVVKYNVETEQGVVTLNEGTRHVKPN